ncbi:MAG: hypothetical protein AB7O28_00805 [Vicinamibacterales bacterium]
MTPDSPHVAVEEGPEGLVVREKRRVANVAISLPFLATAAYLGYGVWLLVAAHARAGTLGTPSGYLPMVLLLLVVGAAFAWPAVALTRLRTVRVRRLDARVEATISRLGVPITRAHPLRDFTAVALRSHLPRRSSRARQAARAQVALVVDLDRRDGRPLRVAFDDVPERIRALAATVSRATGLPVVDGLDDDEPPS